MDRFIEIHKRKSQSKWRMIVLRLEWHVYWQSIYKESEWLPNDSRKSGGNTYNPCKVHEKPFTESSGNVAGCAGGNRSAAYGCRGADSKEANKEISDHTNSVTNRKRCHIARREKASIRD